MIDAEGKTLGRLATAIATILRGKDKPSFTRHMAVGDFVIVINAAKIRVSGRKQSQKIYYHHTQYPGGLREVPYRTMSDRFPDRVIRLAVRGMLPHNRLGRQLLRRLKVYPGPEHPHEAQVRAGQGKRAQEAAEAQAQAAAAAAVAAPPTPARRRRRSPQAEESTSSTEPSGRTTRRRRATEPSEPDTAADPSRPTEDEPGTPESTAPARRRRLRAQTAAESTPSEGSPPTDSNVGTTDTDPATSAPARPEDEAASESETKD